MGWKKIYVDGNIIYKLSEVYETLTVFTFLNSIKPFYPLARVVAHPQVLPHENLIVFDWNI